MDKNGRTPQFENNLISTQIGPRNPGDVALLERAEKINRVLFAISDVVNNTFDLNHLYRSIHHILANIIDVTNFFIAIVDRKERTLYFPYHVDTADDDFAPITDFNTDTALTGLVVLQGKPILMREKELKERNNQNGVWGPAPLIWMGVPLIIKDTVIGVMAIQSYTDPDLFTDQDLQVLSAVSNQTAIGIDRKRSYDELKKSEQRYRKLFDQSNDAIIIHRDKRIIDVNQRACEMLGSNAEQLTKMDIADLEGKAAPEAIRNRYAKVMSGQSMCWESDWKKADGAFIPVEISSRLADHHQGIIQSIGRDITERKNFEAQLRQSQKMEAIGLLAGGVAHDLNNVLSGIVSYPDLILMDIPEDSPLRNKILTIQRSGLKAAEIVQDLLTLARRGVTTTEVIGLNDTILDYMESLEYEKLLAYHPDVSIQTNLSQNPPCIKGSSIQLRKIVMNLVSNAFEASPLGGAITISTRVECVELPIKGYQEICKGNFVVLEVKDSGIGIAKEDLNKIFEPFYTKKALGRSGTGLGMAVVWGIIHDHNGYIDVESKEGLGTTFTLYFPSTGDGIEIQKDIIPIKEYMGKNETILVVDDIEEQRKIAAHILEKLNYTVITAPSGEAAVEHMQTNSADLLILDMIMEPGIDGLETYRRIKALHPNQKAIIASGFAETDRVKEAQRLGAGEYIKKPYTMGKIGLAVGKALGR